MNDQEQEEYEKEARFTYRVSLVGWCVVAVILGLTVGTFW